MLVATIALLAALAQPAAHAPDHAPAASAPACAAPAPPPDWLHAWTQADADGAIVVPDAPSSLPVRTANTGARTAEATLRIAVRSRYAIAIDQRAWIGIAAPAGEELASVGHEHGPPCSGIRKIVRFDLEAGDYRLMLRDTTAEAVRVLAVRIPSD